MTDVYLIAQQPQGSFWLPPQASGFAADTDFAFYMILWISAFFFVGIAGTMFLFMWKYRRRTPGREATGRITHNTKLELLWSIGPGLLLIPMFWLGFTGFMKTRSAPAETYDINVTAQKWNWQFFYPNGIDSDELHVPIDTDVRLVMSSQDVIHSCFIPAFRVKRDVVPGRYTELWFRATRTGVFPLYCAEYCGKGHSSMTTIVEVHARDEYDKWLETADPIKGLTDEQYGEFVKDPEAFIEKYRDDPVIGKIVGKLETPTMMGAKLYKKKGCKTCHTVDGGAHTGPTWKGLFGKPRQFKDGSSIPKADENYIRESILEPGKRIVAGYDNVMSKLSVSDREIDMLIAYIKSLRDE